MGLREEILAVECATQEIEAFGRKLHLREMDGITFEKFARMFDAESNERSRLALIVAFSVVDDQGVPVFGVEDVPKLSRLPYRELDRVATAARELSGLFGASKN